MNTEPEPLISQEQMAALLGRPLSEQESTNFSLYLGITIARIEGVLGGALPLPLPDDLKLVMAQGFALNTAEQKATQMASSGGIVSSKKVEDFSITYDTTAGALWDSFIKQYAAILTRYQVRGSVRVSGRCDDCI